MSKVDQSLLEQMKFSDFEIGKRKTLFDLTEADAKALRSLRRPVADKLDWIITEFYARQTSNPEISLIIGDSDTLSRLKGAMRSYIAEIFNGVFDDAYVNARLRVGKVHWRIGVTPQYFLSALRILNDVLTVILEEEAEEDEPLETRAKREALLKVLFFDSHLVFDTYIFALKSEVMAAQSETVRYADSLEQKIAERTKQLKTLALTDELTGVHNKRSFDQQAKRELAIAQRSSQSIAICYVDVNDFKQLNDTLGHGAGDDLLCTVTKHLQEAARVSDIVARMGGDEFCVLMPGADFDTAAAMAERFAALMHDDHDATVGASVGVAVTGPSDFLSVDDFLHAADQSMYIAKESNRGRKTGTVSIDYSMKPECVIEAALNEEHAAEPDLEEELDAFADEMKADLADTTFIQQSA